MQKSIPLSPGKKMSFCILFPGFTLLIRRTLHWKQRQHWISMVLPHTLHSKQDFKLQRGLSRVEFIVISNEVAGLLPFKLNEQKMSASDYCSASFKEQPLITYLLCVRYCLTIYIIFSDVHNFGGRDWVIRAHFSLSSHFVLSLIEKKKTNVPRNNSGGFIFCE